MRLHPIQAPKAHRSAPRSSALASLACVAVAAALLPACSWMPFRHNKSTDKVHECNTPQVYEQAQSVPVLRVPAGMDPLPTRSALKIPDLREPEAPRALGDTCLDEPPKYSNARLLPVDSGKKKKKHFWSSSPSAPPAAAAPATAPAAPPATPVAK